MNWPNHLMDPDKMEDLFLLELTGLDPVNPQKGKCYAPGWAQGSLT
jgi:hypothetical protein